MLTAQDIGIVIGAIATLITAIGGLAIWRGRGEVKDKDGPSSLAQLIVAIEQNTGAVQAQLDQFKTNNGMFESVLDEAKEIRRIMQELRLDLRGRQ